MLMLSYCTNSTCKSKSTTFTSDGTGIWPHLPYILTVSMTYECTSSNHICMDAGYRYPDTRQRKDKQIYIGDKYWVWVAWAWDCNGHMHYFWLDLLPTPLPIHQNMICNCNPFMPYIFCKELWYLWFLNFKPKSCQKWHHHHYNLN